MELRSDFLWGYATAANQYEGGYIEGGKGLSIADVEKMCTCWRKERNTYISLQIYKFINICLFLLYLSVLIILKNN